MGNKLLEELDSSKVVVDGGTWKVVVVRDGRKIVFAEIGIKFLHGAFSREMVTDAIEGAAKVLQDHLRKEEPKFNAVN